MMDRGQRGSILLFQYYYCVRRASGRTMLLLSLTVALELSPAGVACVIGVPGRGGSVERRVERAEWRGSVARVVGCRSRGNALSVWRMYAECRTFIYIYIHIHVFHWRFWEFLYVKVSFLVTDLAFGEFPEKTYVKRYPLSLNIFLCHL